MVYGIGCGACMIFFGSNTGYSQYGGEPPAVRLSFFLVAHTNMISSRLSAQTLSSSSQQEISVVFRRPNSLRQKLSFYAPFPRIYRSSTSRTRRRERQVYKFPTPLATIPPGAGSNAHTTPTHTHIHKICTTQAPQPQEPHFSFLRTLH